MCVAAANKQFEQCKQWHNRARRLCYGSFMRTECLQVDALYQQNTLFLYLQMNNQCLN